MSDPRLTTTAAATQSDIDASAVKWLTAELEAARDTEQYLRDSRKRARDDADFWMRRARRAEGALRHVANLVAGSGKRIDRARAALKEWRTEPSTNTSPNPQPPVEANPERTKPMNEQAKPDPDLAVSDDDLETRVAYWMERANRAEAALREVSRLANKADMVESIRQVVRQWGEGTDEAFLNYKR